MNGNNTGGMIFVIEGQCDGARESVHKTTGELRMTTNILYFGGSQYVTLADPAQAALLKPKSWVKVTADVREFRDNMFPDRATIIEVDGKPVNGAGKPELVDSSKK